MRTLRKIINLGLGFEKIERKVQPDCQKKKIPQLAMGKIIFGEKSFGLHKVHQNAGKKKVKSIFYRNAASAPY